VLVVSHGPSVLARADIVIDLDHHRRDERRTAVRFAR
jgi:hypothetical protein